MVFFSSASKVRENIGDCRPAYGMYKGIVNSVCTDLVLPFVSLVATLRYNMMHRVLVFVDVFFYDVSHWRGVPVCVSCVKSRHHDFTPSRDLPMYRDGTVSRGVGTWPATSEIGEYSNAYLLWGISFMTIKLDSA